MGEKLQHGASGCPWLHVVQHGLKSLHIWGMSVGQAVSEATVKAEWLQLQPDETKAVLIKQHKEPWGAFWTGKTVSSYQACPIEAEMEKHQMVNILVNIIISGW